LIDRYTNEWTDLQSGGKTGQQTNRQACRHTDGQITTAQAYRWMDDWVHRKMNNWIGKQVYEWMNRQTDAWIELYRDRYTYLWTEKQIKGKTNRCEY